MLDVAPARHRHGPRSGRSGGSRRLEALTVLPTLTVLLAVLAAAAGTGWAVTTSARGATAAGTSTSAAGTSTQAVPAPVGDLPGWRQVMVEDFDVDVAPGDFPGSVYGDRWTGYDGSLDTDGVGRYDPSRVLSVSGGALDMHLRTVDGVPRVAAPVPLVTGEWGGQLHGRFSVRFRADPVPGYKTAWLLWPDSDRWEEGEINFVEGGLDRQISIYNHCPGPNPEVNCLAMDTGVTYQDWHVASVEWTPSAVTYLIDGEVVGVSGVVPTAPMHWVLQTETAGLPDPAAEGHVQVDWVSVWEYAP